MEGEIFTRGQHFKRRRNFLKRLIQTVGRLFGIMPGTVLEHVGKTAGS